MSSALAAVIPAAILVVISQLVRRFRGGSSWNTFGHVSIDNLLNIELPHGNNRILPAVLVINSPQIIMSFLYLVYNSMFTCMLVGREWSQYAVKRATLRGMYLFSMTRVKRNQEYLVTLPTACQRSTHFLQLPYTWSIPLLIADILLHWTISQSIFLVRIAFYAKGHPVAAEFNRMRHRWQYWEGGEKHSEQWGTVFNGIGYSDIALVTSLAMTLSLIIFCRLVAFFRTYDTGLPVGGTNSAVISAACHSPHGHTIQEDGVDIAEKPLQWGVTIRGGTETVGHLCFSDGEVERPEFDCLYAGIKESPVLEAR